MVYWYVLITSGVLGLFVGSFLNVVADRLSLEKDFTRGRSVCNICGKTLGPKNLIPILSFIVQQGKCSFCRAKLSYFYPLSELLTGAAFMLAAHISRFALTMSTATFPYFIFLLVVFSVLVCIFLSDLKYQIIPDQVVYFGIIFVFLFQLGVFGFWSYKSYTTYKNDEFQQYYLKAGRLTRELTSEAKHFGANIATGIGICAFFYALVVATKERGMGGGDVKLGLLIGLFNGFPNGIIAVFLAFVIGSIFSILLMLLQKKSIKDAIPFGPFLILGSVLSLVYGDAIFTRYISF